MIVWDDDVGCICTLAVGGILMLSWTGPGPEFDMYEDIIVRMWLCGMMMWDVFVH